MSTLPLFSVVIPTYNRAHLLTRAMQSVLDQSYDDFELIIVDDVSPDDTMASVKALADPRIVYLPRTSNGGAAASRNSGIRKARGQYIAFLDDDDEFLPNFLQVTAQSWQQAAPAVGFTWCARQMVRESAEGLVVLKEEAWTPKFDSLEEAYLSFLDKRQIGTADGLTLRRSVFDDVGFFDEAMRKAEDTDFLIRVARRYEFIVIPELLIRRYEHSGPRLTHYDSTMADAYERIIAKNREALEEHPSLRADKHYKTAWLYYHGGNRGKARQHMRHALHANPAQPRLWFMWLLFETSGGFAPGLHRQLARWKAQLAK